MPASKLKGQCAGDTPNTLILANWRSIRLFPTVAFGQAKCRVTTFISTTAPLLYYECMLQIEVLSHYGNEHYCPITIIRVYGMGVDDDDDDDNTSSHEEEEVVVKQEDVVTSTEAPPTDDKTKSNGEGSNV